MMAVIFQARPESSRLVMYAHETPFHDQLRQRITDLGGVETATPQRCTDGTGTIITGYTINDVATRAVRDVAVHIVCHTQHTRADTATAMCTVLKARIIDPKTQAIMCTVPTDQLIGTVTPKQLTDEIERVLHSA